MSDEFRTIEDRLRKQHMNLSHDERERAWSAIRTEIASAPMTVESPYRILSIFSYKHYVMIPTLIAILLLAGGGTVVAASDDARPGDVLFPVDRAVENVRIAFAGDDKKDELRVRFAEERATEVESIIDEEGARTRLAMETRAKSSGPQPETALMAVSDDTATSDDNRDDGDDDGSEHIAVGLSTAIDYLSQVSAELEAKGNTQAQEAVDAVIDRLNAKIGDIPEELRVRLQLDNEGDDDEIRVRVRTENEEGDDTNKGEVEVRGDGVRTKVEFKNGEFKIESKVEDDSDDSNDDSSDSFEVEADVFTDKTIVKIEHDGIKEVFITQENTRAGVVAAVAAYLDVSEASVDAVLDFEVENRVSRTTDLLLLSGNSGNDDDGGDDDSSLEDDDNSGSGSDDSGDDSEDDDDSSGSGSGSGHGGGDDDDDDLLDINL